MTSTDMQPANKLDDLDTFLAEEGILEEVTERARVRVRHSSDAYAITQPVIVHSRADIASLLRAHRMSMGLTCEAFDALAGWSDRYVTKLEHGDKPSCKRGFEITPPTSDDPDHGRAYSGNVTASFMSEIWLETAGLRLVLMPAELAERIGAMPAPKRVTAQGERT